MPRICVLAIDQGTTNTKAVLEDDEGIILARASSPVRTRFPAPGWVEQDPDEIWRATVDCVGRCLGSAADFLVRGIGVTNQRESVVAWSRATGEPVGPCLTWQCRRTAEACARIRDSALGRVVRERSGLPVDPLFSASKARWLLDHVPDGLARAAQGELCVGTVDSWLLWNLTGGAVHACDVSNASRTQLLDLRTLAWDPLLLDVFGIPAAALPRIVLSSGVVGATAGSGLIPAGIPIAGVAGDSHAALFGNAAFEPGTVKATYGTGSSLMALIDGPQLAPGGLSTTVAWALPDGARYAVEGNITVTGSAVEWLGQLLGLPDPASDVARLAATVGDTGGVYLVPAFAGLGAPYWDADARGIVCGLTRGTQAAHLARATLEAIAYQVRDVFDAMREGTGTGLDALLADGGASANDAVMQFQADLLGCPVIRNRTPDLAARGAGWLAGLATGVWRGIEDLRRLPRPVDRFEPSAESGARTHLYAGWRRAVTRARESSLVPADPAQSMGSSCNGSN
jgi:glycerol kinase